MRWTPRPSTCVLHCSFGPISVRPRRPSKPTPSPICAAPFPFSSYHDRQGASMKFAFIGFVGALVSVFPATIVHAQDQDVRQRQRQAIGELAKEGKYEHHGCYIGPQYVITHSKEQMSGSYAANGVAIAPLGDPFHNVAGVCYGHWTLLNGEFNDSGTCEFATTASEKFFGVYSRRNDEDGRWQVTGGTGKFSGMSLEGFWLPVTQTPQPTGQLITCNRQWGSWKFH
jgi:hypothetical protein